MAAATDLLQEVGIATATTLDAPGYTAGGTSITVASTTNWPTATGVTFAMDVIDASGDQVAGSYNEYVGTVASATSVTNVAHQNGTDRNYSAGTTTRVYIPVSAERENRIVEWGLVEHNQAGAHTDITVSGTAEITGVTTLTTHLDINDASTAIRDTSDNELLKFAKTATAVNEVTVTNAATGAGPTLSATGSDTNINLNLTPKGTGRVVLNGAGDITADYVATSQTRTNATYGDLATVGPTAAVTIGPSGKALVTIGVGGMFNNTGSGTSFMAFAVSGASTVAATDTMSIKLLASSGSLPQVGFGNTFLVTGLTAGANTFTAKYRSTGADTATFVDRRIIVQPL